MIEDFAPKLPKNKDDSKSKRSKNAFNNKDGDESDLELEA